VTQRSGHLVGQFNLEATGANFRSKNPINPIVSDDEGFASIMAEVGPHGAAWILTSAKRYNPVSPKRSFSTFAPVMPSISHIANLWSLVGHPSPKKEWSLERKIEAVAESGFDGITTALTPDHRRFAEKHGLKDLLGFISTNDSAEFVETIRAQKEAGAVHINVQLDDHDTPPVLAAKHWIKLVRAAEKIGGVVPALEVHRDCCTETPEKTYEIAERYFDATGELIHLNFDFSHFSVVKHLNPTNYVERLLDHPDLVQNSDQSHCRPFNGHHCQVAVTFRNKLTPETVSYLEFVRALFACWKKAPRNLDRTLYVCPEMGPYTATGGGYNITGLPPAWTDAVRLRTELAKAWKSV